MTAATKARPATMSRAATGGSDEVARFWAKVRKSEGCWEWTAHRQPNNGYGSFKVGGKHGCVVRAHRYSWELANGRIPEGLRVLHRCDNPPCVRPDHLWLGTQGDNNRDRNAKGRNNPERGTDRYNARLNPDMVREIRSSVESGRAIARRLGVSRSVIQSVRKGRSWKHVA